MALSATLLLAMGRPLVYRHGPVRLWSDDVQSDQNSQQLADPYTLTHVTHGVLLFGLVGLAGRRLPVRTRVVVALALECAWEVLENTDAVIQRYRAATVSLGYYGDSVLNTVGDVLAAALGASSRRGCPCGSSSLESCCSRESWRCGSGTTSC